MRRILLGAFSFVLICELLCTCPAAASVSTDPGVSRAGGSLLDDFQQKFAATLRLVDRERDYAAEKGRYQQAMAERCSGQKWYDLGFLECALIVPIFGLILPFFGTIFFDTLRSRRRASSAGATE